MAGRMAPKKWATVGSLKYKWDTDGIWTSAVTRPTLKAAHTSWAHTFLLIPARPWVLC